MPSNIRYKSIKIIKPLDVIIVEFVDVCGTIIPGSRLFCGRCGHQLGTVLSAIQFPFDDYILLSSMNKDHSIYKGYYGGFGFTHKTCGNVLFEMQSNWIFVSLKIYFIDTNGLIETNKLINKTLYKYEDE